MSPIVEPEEGATGPDSVRRALGCREGSVFEAAR